MSKRSLVCGGGVALAVAVGCSTNEDAPTGDVLDAKTETSAMDATTDAKTTESSATDAEHDGTDATREAAVDVSTVDAAAIDVGVFDAGKLVFQDDFDGTRLDPSRWNVQDDVHGGYVNASLEFGNAWYDPARVTVSGGLLGLELALQDGTDASGHAMHYVTGGVTTEKKASVQHGWFVASIRVSSGPGLWPSFWMDDDPGPDGLLQEIDVFEIFGDPRVLSMHSHEWSGSTQVSQMGFDDDAAIDLGADFHTYAVHTTPTNVIWYLDGTEVYRNREGIPETPLYVLFDNEVGPTDWWTGPWSTPDSTTVIPQKVLVDWVRMYSDD